MSFNSFGHLLRVTTWGESHGPAIGCVVDGCPPGIALTEADIQPFLDARRPGTSRFTTQRREPDMVRILSGVFPDADGTPRTTGTPISLMIDNVDQRSRDYSDVAKAYRPGHADYAYDAKYGFRDYRGGGRSSARETAMRVAAGAVARLIIGGVRITAWTDEIGGDRVDPERFDAAAIGSNPFFCPDPEAAARWEALVDGARKAGSSLGAVVACRATGVPAGWGAPVYAKLDASLASAMTSINAVKGVEIGDGFRAARLSGEQNADPMRPGDHGDGPAISRQSCRRRGGRYRHRPAGHRPYRVQADQLDPHPGPDDRPQRGRHGYLHQRSPRSMCRHPRRAGGRGNDGAGSGRSVSAPPRAMWLGICQCFD